MSTPARRRLIRDFKKLQQVGFVGVVYSLASFILLVLADNAHACALFVFWNAVRPVAFVLCWVGRVSRLGLSCEGPPHPAPANLYVFDVANAWREPGDGFFGAPVVDGLNARSSQDPPSGISGAPCDNDIMKWSAVIFG